MFPFFLKIGTCILIFGTVETFLYSMPSVWLILFYSFDSNPDAPAPPESSKKADSDSDDFGDSDNDSMSDWR